MKEDSRIHSPWRHRIQPLLVFAALGLGLLSMLLVLVSNRADIRLPANARATLLQRSVVAIGVGYRDQGDAKYLWLGTGFFAKRGKDDTIGVTAGHVILECRNTYNELHTKDLSPTFVACLQNGNISEIGHLRHHPILLKGLTT